MEALGEQSCTLERRRRDTHVPHFHKNHQHIVFSTSKRLKLIDTALRPKLWAYIAGICRNHGIFVRTIGGVEDHVHLLIELHPTWAVAKAVLTMKSNSSKTRFRTYGAHRFP